MGNRKPEMSRDHGLTVAFAVCSSRLNGRESFKRLVTKNKMTPIKNKRLAEI